LHPDEEKAVMSMKPRFLSLRQQGLLAMLLLVIAALSSWMLTQDSNRLMASTEQKRNAEYWLQHLVQTLVSERQQALEQQLLQNNLTPQGEFVFLQWYPDTDPTPQVSANTPVAPAVLLALLDHSALEQQPVSQIDCSHQCLLLQSLPLTKQGTKGRVIAMSRLDSLLQRLQQATGIYGFFLGALAPELTLDEQWQQQPQNEFQSLLASAIPPQLANSSRQFITRQPAPSLTLGAWSQQLARKMSTPFIWVAPLPDAQVADSLLADPQGNGPHYLLLMAEESPAMAAAGFWPWLPLTLALFVVFGWGGWQLHRLRRLQQLLDHSVAEASSTPLTPPRQMAHDELSVMALQAQAIHHQLDENHTALTQQATLLQQHSLYDPLTGLPNRDCFMFEVGRQLAALQRYPAQLALILLEVNGFRQLSHAVGHEEGERLLQKVAQELSLSIREADLLCHLSGDLFALLITNLQEEEQVDLIITKLQSRLESSLLLTDRNFSLQFAAGVVLIKSSDTPANELLRQAEMALNEVKLQADQRYQLYSPKLQEKSVRNHFIEQRLTQALRSGEIYLQYQPIQDCKQHKIIGLEALSRWQLPLEGNIPPLEFIPILENSPLGLQFGNWVLEKSLHQLHQLDVAGLTGLQMAINLTGQQLLDPELKNTLERLTLTYHIIPSRISLELNEQALRVNYQQAQQVMASLHQAGYRLTLDDFGTGYSALTYLSRLPFHTIKLDRSFTLRMLDCEMDKQLVGNIIQMAHSLGKRIIGEGVDNSLQSLWLQELGCDQLQGHILAAPIGECDLLSQLAPLYQVPRINTLDSTR
jgi:diguanylate cyclase (GGDEF)-like protein